MSHCIGDPDLDDVGDMPQAFIKWLEEGVAPIQLRAPPTRTVIVRLVWVLALEIREPLICVAD